MSAEDYIAQYGATLTEAEKRYIRAVGPPPGFHAGPARNPYTPGLRVGDYDEHDDDDDERRLEQEDEQEAFDAGELF